MRQEEQRHREERGNLKHAENGPSGTPLKRKQRYRGGASVLIGRLFDLSGAAETKAGSRGRARRRVGNANGFQCGDVRHKTTLCPEESWIVSPRVAPLHGRVAVWNQKHNIRTTIHRGRSISRSGPDELVATGAVTPSLGPNRHLPEESSCNLGEKEVGGAPVLVSLDAARFGRSHTVG